MKPTVQSFLGTFSLITGKILPEVRERLNRPLENIHPVVFFDEIVFKSRKGNKAANKFVYSV